jgi:hypothetical protein
MRKAGKIERTPLLFPGYAFVLIVLQWHAARFAPGVIGLIMDGERPARVPDSVPERRGFRPSVLPAL